MSALALASVLACVPSTADLEPTGAAGFTLLPSAASRGEPFETADGWTVTVDQLLVLASVNARPTREDEAEEPKSTGDQLLFSVRSREPVFVPGVPVGETRLRVYFGKIVVNLALDDPGTAVDVRQFVPRFREGADLTYDYLAPGPRRAPPALRHGPSVLVSFHAEHEGRRVRGALTMAANPGRSVRFPRLLVTADALVTTPLEAHAEALFHTVPACGEPTCSAPGDLDAAPPLLFAPFAAADRDEDGILTGAEIKASSEGGSFANELLERAGGIFTVPPS